MIGPPPDVLLGEEIAIKYISLLAQAQEAVAAGSIERGLSFAGNLVAVVPDVMDNVDVDASYREYASIIGMGPDNLRSPDEVATLRAQRAEQQQQQMALEQAGQAAQAAKVLSEADTQQPNALTALTAGLGRR